jgi:hypothetical protein
MHTVTHTYRPRRRRRTSPRACNRLRPPRLSAGGVTHPHRGYACWSSGRKDAEDWRTARPPSHKGHSRHSWQPPFARASRTRALAHLANCWGSPAAGWMPGGVGLRTRTSAFLALLCVIAAVDPSVASRVALRCVREAGRGLRGTRRATRSQLPFSHRRHMCGRSAIGARHLLQSAPTLGKTRALSSVYRLSRCRSLAQRGHTQEVLVLRK